MEKVKAFAARYEGAYGGRVKTMLFPYRLDACTPELLRETKAAARELNVPIRIHVAQFLPEFCISLNDATVEENGKKRFFANNLLHVVLQRRFFLYVVGVSKE